MNKVKNNYEECFERFCQRFNQTNDYGRAKQSSKFVDAVASSKPIKSTNTVYDNDSVQSSQYYKSSSISTPSINTKLSSVVKIGVKSMSSPTPFVSSQPISNYRNNHKLSEFSKSKSIEINSLSSNCTFEISDNSPVFNGNSKKRPIVIDDDTNGSLDASTDYKFTKVFSFSVFFIFISNYFYLENFFTFIIFVTRRIASTKL